MNNKRCFKFTIKCEYIYKYKYTYKYSENRIDIIEYAKERSSSEYASDMGWNSPWDIFWKRAYRFNPSDLKGDFNMASSLWDDARRWVMRWDMRDERLEMIDERD